MSELRVFYSERLTIPCHVSKMQHTRDIKSYNMRSIKSISFYCQ